jgi:hypothetical protein
MVIRRHATTHLHGGPCYSRASIDTSRQLDSFRFPIALISNQAFDEATTRLIYRNLEYISLVDEPLESVAQGRNRFGMMQAVDVEQLG